MTTTSTGPARPDPSQTGTDREIKRDRLLGLLDRRGADRLVLTSATSLAWYLDGARTHISLAAPPIVAMVVDRDGEHLLTTDNESERLIGEELPAGLEVRTVPWFDRCRSPPATEPCARTRSGRSFAACARRCCPRRLPGSGRSGRTPPGW